MDNIKWIAPLSVFGEAAPAEDQNTSFLGDLGTAVEHGVTVGIPRALTGLADLGVAAFGGDYSVTNAFNEAYGNRKEQELFNELTPETREALANVEAAEGFGDSAIAYATNPRAAAFQVAEALPASVAGGGIGALGVRGAGAVAGRLAGRAAAKEIAGNAASIQAAGANAARQAGTKLERELVKKELAGDVATVGKHKDLLGSARKKAFEARVAQRKQDFVDAANEQYGVNWLKGGHAATIGASAGEGLVGAGMGAASIAQYNAEHPDERSPLEGVGYGALGGALTGAVAYGFGRGLGSIEAGIFNTPVRKQITQGSWKTGLPRTMGVEAAEEAAQAPGETITQNVATDQPWDQGLGANVVGSAIAGGLMGGGGYGAARALRWATPREDRAQIQPTQPDIQQAVGTVGPMDMSSGTPIITPAQPAAETETFEPQNEREAQVMSNVQANLEQEEAEKQAELARKHEQNQLKELERQQKRNAKAQEREQRRLQKEEKAKQAQEAAALNQQRLENYSLIHGYKGRKEGIPANYYNRGQTEKPAYAAGAAAIRAAYKATSAKRLEGVHKPGYYLDLAFKDNPSNLDNNESLATWFEGLAKGERATYKTNDGANNADAFELIAEQLRNPETPVEQIVDRRERNLAFKRYEDANKASKAPTYDLYDIQAGNLKPGNAQVKFELMGQEITFQGKVRNKKFIPDEKQLNDFAEYAEGKKASHDEFYQGVMKAINPSETTTHAEAAPSETSENPLSSGRTVGLEELSASKTEEGDNASEAMEAVGMHVESDIGASKTTDENKVANNFVGRLMYRRLLTHKSNRGDNGKRVIELDTKNQTFTDGSLAQLEQAVKDRPEIAKEVADTLSGKAATDMADRLSSWKDKKKAATAALEILASLNRIATAGNIDSKRLEPLIQKLYNTYLQGQQAELDDGVETDGFIRPIDWTRIPFLGRKIAARVANRGKVDVATGFPKPLSPFGEPPVFRINFAAIRKIKAETQAGREIQKDCYVIADPLTEGLAVPVKTILEKCHNPKEDLKGLFSDRFINYVVPAVKRMYTTLPFKLNDDLILVDGGIDAVEMVEGDRRWTPGISHGQVTNMTTSRFVLEIPLDGKALPMPRIRSKQEFLSAYLKGLENKPFLEYLPYHELFHVNCRAVGTKRAHAVIEKHLDAIKSAFLKIRQMAPSDVKGYNYPGGITEEAMGTLAYILEYPELAQDNADPSEQHYTYVNETYATLLGLHEINPIFEHLLTTPEFKELADIVNEAIYVGSVSSNNERSTGNLAQTAGGSGDSAGQSLSDAGRRDRGSKQEDRGVEEGPSGRAMGSGEGDAGRPEAKGTAGSQEPKGLMSRTERGLDRLIDKYLRNHPNAKRFSKDVSHFIFRSVLGGLFTRDIIKMAVDATGIKAFEKWGEAHEQINKLRNELLEDAAQISNKFARMNKADRDVANEYIKDAVLRGAWGYAHPSVFKTQDDYNTYLDGLKDKNKAAAELELARRWDNLNAKQQEAIQDVFEYGNEQLRKRYQLLKEKLSEAAMREGNVDPDNPESVLQDTLLKEFAADVTRLSKVPYVPLMRSGSHMVIFKSAAYLQAEKNAQAAVDHYNSLKEKTKEDKKVMREAIENFNRMKSSGDDYAVEFVNGYGSAEAIADEYKAAYPGAKVVFGDRIEALQDNVPGYKQLERAANMLAKNLEEGLDASKYGASAQQLAKQLHSMITQMYIESLADTSAKKRMLKKRTVRGFNENMVENLMAAAPSTANMLAYMRHSDDVAAAGREIDEAVRKLQDTNPENYGYAREFQKELIQRENQSSQESSNLTNSLLRTTSFMMLLTNPAYYLQNMTQAFMMSAPFMADRHGARAFKALVENTKEVAKWMKDDPDLSKLEKIMNDPKIPEKEKPLKMDEWKALDHSRRRGIIDIGMTQDFGDIQRGGSKVRDTAVAMTDWLNRKARQVEIINRTATFLTAYRLEKARMQSNEAARKYADDVIYQTHGDYSAFNAPKWFTYNGVTRVMTQFRKFQLIQAGLMIRLLGNSLRGATPEMRSEARRQFAYMLGTHLAFTGLKGTPFAGVLLGLGAALGGDDGDDGEDWVRKMIGDKEFSTLLMRGAPAWLGMDLSGKIGAENMLDPMAYSNAKVTDGRAGANEMLVNLFMGPSASLAQRLFTAGQYFAQGDHWKGMEYLLPNGLATNLSKGVRFATEGYTSKAGDRLLAPEDYDVSDFLIQTLGFQPKIMSDRMRLQDTLIRHKEHFDAEKNRVYMDYKKARHDRDGRRMLELRREMAKLSREARAQGFTGYTVANMVSAANSQAKRERQAVGGVSASKSDRQFVKKMSEL